ncbi:MAG TPA: hypothetical protein VL202_21195 [Pararhizobium sp.]|uniref:hypothetical protein n=1 Tax=Pararhizobium sp. TaxID=1977563 RepID=UPI002B94C487|nr:hypothetical protein [Pararhizobium sp.]HTO33662.1 hypothetical protein [Pararhizobium sp.]
MVEKTPALLFIANRHPYLAGMRYALVILAVFCALISGWTPALAQVQDLDGMNMGGAVRHGSGVHATQASSADIHCPPQSKACAHHPKMVHPLLCAACFAVVIDAFGLERDAIDAGTVPPALQTPLLAASIKPRFPPPKSFVLLS